MQLRSCIALEWIHWGQVWAVWFITKPPSLCIEILSWNFMLLMYLPRTSNTKRSCAIGDGNIFSLIPSKLRRWVRLLDPCSARTWVMFWYGRLQNHINYAQQLYCSWGFSFPSLHCHKVNKPFHLKVFLHSKMQVQCLWRSVCCAIFSVSLVMW